MLLRQDKTTSAKEVMRDVAGNLPDDIISVQSRQPRISSPFDRCVPVPDSGEAACSHCTDFRPLRCRACGRMRCDGGEGAR